MTHIPPICRSHVILCCSVWPQRESLVIKLLRGGPIVTLVTLIYSQESLRWPQNIIGNHGNYEHCYMEGGMKVKLSYVVLYERSSQNPFSLTMCALPLKFENTILFCFVWKGFQLKGIFIQEKLDLGPQIKGI